MFVSSGPEPIEPKSVPNVLLTNLEDAKKSIKNAGFEVGKVEYQNHASYPKGIVISQNPEKDTMAQPESKINLVVASGFKDFSLPVALPDTTATLDMSVYINGSLASQFNKNTFVPVETEILLLKEQKEQYQVLVKLRKHGTTEWLSYKQYVINSINQSVSEEQLMDDSVFADSLPVTTTTATPTTNTTETDFDF
ncbi:MAG TPA: hypothetical protein DEP23_16350 [Ruminococcaceae bacterium]|nr:hypothetical protein [Oscillospiraceae bacterium]